MVGELEDAGDELVNEFGLYRRDAPPGRRFHRSAHQSRGAFIRRWTGTKQQLTAIVEKQRAVQLTLEGTDEADR